MMMHMRASSLLAALALLCGCNAMFGYKPGGDGNPGSDAQGDSRHPDGKAVLPGCGNGRAEGSEECDGTELRGQGCASLGLIAGDLRCSSSCGYEYGGCTSCGDHQLQGVEQCDGNERGGRSCTSLGFASGQLGCSGCKLDASTCTMPAGHGRLLHGTGKELVFRLLDTVGLTWGPPVVLPAVGAPRWTVNRISPTNPGDEVAAALAETPSDLRLHLLHLGKEGWVVDEVVTVPVASVERAVRIFDLVYEAKSGDALLVYSDETSNPVYRTYRGGWSAPARVFSASAPGTTPVRWVTLARRAASDEIALLYSDAETRVFGVIWNGDQFVKSTEGYDAAEPTTNPYPSFAACYEDQSGTLLYAAVGSCCSCFGYCTKPGTSLTAFKCGGVSGGVCGPWGLMKMAAHEGGNEILLVGDERKVAVWRPGPTGTMGWGGGAQLAAPSASNGVTWFADGAWTVGASPVAIVVHRGWPDDLSTGGSGRIFWGKYTTGWTTGAPLKVPGMGVLSWPQLEPLSGSGVIGVFSDDKGQLWAGTHDTNAWTMIPGSPIGSGLPTAVTRVFSIDIRR